MPGASASRLPPELNLPPAPTAYFTEGSRVEISIESKPLRGVLY